MQIFEEKIDEWENSISSKLNNMNDIKKKQKHLFKQYMNPKTTRSNEVWYIEPGNCGTFQNPDWWLNFFLWRQDEHFNEGFIFENTRV